MPTISHPNMKSIKSDAPVGTIFVSYNAEEGAQKLAMSCGSETAIRVWNGKKNAAMGIARRRAKAAQDLVSRVWCEADGVKSV
jgi:hypothetical protein